jgi:hypothetical protein
MGSTPAARRAGSAHANAATDASTSVAPTITRGLNPLLLSVCPVSHHFAEGEREDDSC